MIFAIFFIVMILLFVACIWGDPHDWYYRNPYDRTCRKCGRNEVSHCLPGEWNRAWWEVFNEGDESKH